MKSRFLLLVLFLSSCSSSHSKNELSGKWMVNDEHKTVYEFTNDILTIHRTIDAGMMVINSKNLYEYKVDKDQLKLIYLKSKVTHNVKKTPEGVILHDTYAKSNYQGPKELVLKFTLKNDLLTLLKEGDT